MDNLDYFSTSFSGFNKKTKFYEGEFLKDRSEWEGDYHFDENLYKIVAADIICVLGEKEAYTGQEAYYYFHKRYFAYPINYRNMRDYLFLDYVSFGAFDKFSLDDDGCLEKFSGEEGEYFSYLKNKRMTSEKTITLVIDLSNEALRERFPKVKKYFEDFEASLIKEFGSFERYRFDTCGYFVKRPDGEIENRTFGGTENIILVIGSFDNKTINSMNVIFNDGFIDELGYAVEFFRRHS